VRQVPVHIQPLIISTHLQSEKNLCVQRNKDRIARFHSTERRAFTFLLLNYKNKKDYVAISMMRGPLPTLKGLDNPSCSAFDSRVAPV
jgi:hypothetical protein